MTRRGWIRLMIWLAGGLSLGAQRPLFPQHIETPEYLPIAGTAHVMGKVALAVTIDEHGNVQNAEAATNSSIQQAPPMLQKYAIENVRRWIFPKTALGTSKVTFDLPERVTILTNLEILNTEADSTAH